VRAARGALDGGVLLVAGAVSKAAQIRALAEAGADAFTVGSAVFDGSYAPDVGSLRSQLRAVLDAC
jgi:pentose-5-phosphate-3-epimerase